MPGLSLPFLTAFIPSIPAKIREQVTDFIVEEVPAYTPMGVGEHCYLFVEKEKLSTHQMVGIFARSLAVHPNDIGFAGLKDAQAISRQWISVPAFLESHVNAFAHPQIRVLKIGRHKNKLRIGHLKGNRFQIRLRDVRSCDVPRARAVLDILEKKGVPNYFGEQRFGVREDTHLVGKAILDGEAKEMRHVSKKMRFLYLSAYQSYLFNRCLAKRIHEIDQLFLGDLAAKHENGAVFRVIDPVSERLRLEKLEISPTGPLFGEEMICPEGQEKELEESVLHEEGVRQDYFRSPFRDIKLTGERRPYRFPVSELAMSYREGILDLSFFLPKGCYATALLREIIKF